MVKMTSQKYKLEMRLVSEVFVHCVYPAHQPLNHEIFVRFMFLQVFGLTIKVLSLPIITTYYLSTTTFAWAKVFHL